MVAWGVCMVLFGGGHAWFYSGGVRGFIWGVGGHAWFYWGHVWFYVGGHAWFYSAGGACMVYSVGGVCGFIQWGGMCGFIQGGGMRGFFSFSGYNEIWSMSGRYASYWNAFLFLCNFRHNLAASDAGALLWEILDSPLRRKGYSARFPQNPFGN